LITCDQEDFIKPIFLSENTSVSPKKYFAKSLELFEPINMLFGTALTVSKFFGLTKAYSKTKILVLIKLPGH